jgi:hypothetical protein
MKKHNKTRLHQDEEFPGNRILCQQLKGMDAAVKLFIAVLLIQFAFFIYMKTAQNKSIFFNPVPLAIVFASLGYMHAYNKEGETYRIKHWKIREDHLPHEKENHYQD